MVYIHIGSELTFDGCLLVQVIRNDYAIEDCPTVEEIARGEEGNVTLDVGYIRQCYINQFFEQIQEYDKARSGRAQSCLLSHTVLSPSLSLSVRYGLGVVVCCLALTTVVLTLVGVVLGVVGWSKDRSPDSRTKISHCGGIVLLV